MVAAGIEGGSKRSVEEDWDLDDVSDLRRHWRESGPPTHIAVAAFSAAWGVKLTGDPEPDQPVFLEPPKGSRTIAELSEGISVVPGGDTLAASQAVLARLHQS